MAKTSTLYRNIHRKALCEKYKAQRDSLRARSLDLKLTLDERMEARAALSLLPANSSPTRVKNRCQITGRSHAYIRKFGICRTVLRRMAHAGFLPGVTKASW
jgi:small subunit ribosomal protein S14